MADLYPNYTPKMARHFELAGDIIIVDGQGGCGKTLFSPIIGAIDRVEIMNYAFPVEWACRLHFFNSLSFDGAVSQVQRHTDAQLYQNMMGREVNFRFSDLSSAFRAHRPLRYFKRIFAAGDMAVPDRIAKERPILNLTTHDLLPISKPVFSALGERLKFIEIVRHPLFMLIQQTLNMERLVNNPRDIGIYFEHEGKTVPYYGFAQRDTFLSLSPVDQAIRCIEYQTRLTADFKKKNRQLYEGKLVTIPFELFVKNPEPYMQALQSLIGFKQTAVVRKELSRQKVPRENVVDGIPLAIYKRCGWQPPRPDLSEQDEYKLRRQFAVDQGASKECLAVLDDLSQEYEAGYQVF